LRRKLPLKKERKPKKSTFKDESKKKAPKDPFDLEGLQKVLKTMSNEMVEIKKQVVESSKNPFDLSKGINHHNHNHLPLYQMLNLIKMMKRKNQPYLLKNPKKKN
jgi:hypothetical protein